MNTLCSFLYNWSVRAISIERVKDKYAQPSVWRPCGRNMYGQGGIWTILDIIVWFQPDLRLLLGPIIVFNFICNEYMYFYIFIVYSLLGLPILCLWVEPEEESISDAVTSLPSEWLEKTLECQWCSMNSSNLCGSIHLLPPFPAFFLPTVPSSKHREWSSRAEICLPWQATGKPPPTQLTFCSLCAELTVCSLSARNSNFGSSHPKKLVQIARSASFFRL